MRSLTILILFITILSGCTSQDSDPTEDERQIGEPVGSSRPSASLALEDCDGVLMLSTVRSEWVDPFVREGFNPRAPAPGANLVNVMLMHCARVVIGDTVREDVGLFEAGVWAETDFGDEKDPSSYFVVGSYTNDEVVLKTLSDLGVTIDLAEFDDRGEAVASPLEARGWTITGSGFGFDFDFLENREIDQGEWPLENDIWYPGPPHVHLNITGHQRLSHTAENHPVALEMKGHSEIRDLFGGNDHWILDNGARTHAQYLYEFTGGYTP